MDIYKRLNPDAIPLQDVILENRKTTFVVVKWNSEKLGDPPSEEELQQIFDEFAMHYSDYGVSRRREYPPVEYYLDGIVKGDQAQIQDYINQCLAVKEKYPKP